MLVLGAGRSSLWVVAPPAPGCMHASSYLGVGSSRGQRPHIYASLASRVLWPTFVSMQCAANASTQDGPALASWGDVLRPLWLSKVPGCWRGLALWGAVLHSGPAARAPTGLAWTLHARPALSSLNWTSSTDHVWGRSGLERDRV